MKNSVLNTITFQSIRRIENKSGRLPSGYDAWITRWEGDQTYHEFYRKKSGGWMPFEHVNSEYMFDKSLYGHLPASSQRSLNLAYNERFMDLVREVMAKLPPQDSDESAEFRGIYKNIRYYVEVSSLGGAAIFFNGSDVLKNEEVFDFLFDDDTMTYRSLNRRAGEGEILFTGAMKNHYFGDPSKLTDVEMEAKEIFSSHFNE